MRLLPAFFVALGVSLLSVAFASPVRPPINPQMYDENGTPYQRRELSMSTPSPIDVWFVPGITLGHRNAAVHGDFKTVMHAWRRVEGFLRLELREGVHVSWQNGYSMESHLDHIRFRTKYAESSTRYAIGIVNMGSGPDTATTDPFHGVYEYVPTEKDGDFEKLLETFRQKYPAATPANGV
ncbi:hypothetical protein GG344DRAFT_81914 [Lentinula edodes]|nr:hypothetical protein GG344DRAFT_81914 [Lentinula edodes]